MRQCFFTVIKLEWSNGVQFSLPSLLVLIRLFVVYIVDILARVAESFLAIIAHPQTQFRFDRQRRGDLLRAFVTRSRSRLALEETHVLWRTYSE